MLKEDKIVFQNKKLEIFETLLKQNKKPTEIEEGISLIYIGGKNEEIISKIKNILNNNGMPNNNKFSLNFVPDKKKEEDKSQDNKHALFLIEYKNIYIGGLSTNLIARDGFGLNKYKNSSSFYLGHWKNNMKEGIGFLKVDDNKLYIGSFHLNQFEGFGILYYKQNNTFYFGEFKNGGFNNGIYCNINKELYYRGRFEKNKKNDSFCSFLEKNNKHLFLGEVKDDDFVKGYLCLYKTNEISREDENGDEIVINFNIDKIFYFDKTDKNNISFIDNVELENELRNNILESMQKNFEIDIRLKQKVKDIINYFDYLESLADDEDHNYLERYNEDNEQSLEKFFMSNYGVYFSQFQEEEDINEIRREIVIP